MSHLGKVFSCLLLASVVISAQQSIPVGQKGPVSASAHSQEASIGKQDRHVMAFGENGQIKMLYDRRQRPQSVLLNEAAYIALNDGAEAGAEGRSPTRPMIVEYDPNTREFSNGLMLGSGSGDHYYGPVIGADNDDYLQVLSDTRRIRVPRLEIQLCSTRYES